VRLNTGTTLLHNGLIKFPKGQGKSTCTFSAQRWQTTAFRLLALTTEAWRGAEIHRRSVENVYVDLPGPISKVLKKFIWHLIQTL
jgi:hypothetical protein